MSGDQAEAVAAKSRKRFYVYMLYETPEVVLYIGKGSGRRFKTQLRRFHLSGRIVREFDCEREAFKCEQALIAASRPELNKNKGGSGGWKRYKAPKVRKLPNQALIDRLGTRVYCARMLLKFDLAKVVPPERLAIVKGVAYGAPL
jgi:hypothetical protein